jgi:small subunit ribosomal protein S6
MEKYELVFICANEVPAEKVTQITEKVKALITEQKGEVHLVNPWGKKRLAYPIAGNTEGNYIFMEFAAPPETISKIENYLKIAEEVIRHLVIKKVTKKHAVRRQRAGKTETSQPTVAPVVPSVSSAEETPRH